MVSLRLEGAEVMGGLRSWCDRNVCVFGFWVDVRGCCGCENKGMVCLR